MTKSTQHPTAVRHVTFLVFPRVLLLDIAGPMQVFSSANQLAKDERYAVHVLGRHKGPVETDSGMQVVADLSFSDDVPAGDFVVPGGPAVDEVIRDPEYVDYVRRSAPNHQRTLAICSGSMLLAEAGLLDGKRATTHWVRAAQVRRQFSK